MDKEIRSADLRQVPLASDARDVIGHSEKSTAGDPGPSHEQDGDCFDYLTQTLRTRAEVDALLEEQITRCVDAGGTPDEMDQSLREAISRTYEQGRWPDVYAHLVGVAKRRSEFGESLGVTTWAEIEKSLDEGATVARARSVLEDSDLPGFVRRRVLRWLDTWAEVVREIDIGGSGRSVDILLRTAQMRDFGATDEDVLAQWLDIAHKRMRRNEALLREGQAVLALKLDDGSTTEEAERALDAMRTKGLPECVHAELRSFVADRQRVIR